MKFGLSKNDYQFIQETVIKPLTNKGAMIWCFGSRARGDHQPFSDLDLMVESKVDLSREIGAINEKLIESNFPFKVDIVQHKDFAQSYRENFLRDRKAF